MLFYTGLIFLVIAVSLDGFGVGVTYGMQKIRVPLVALAIIMLCSGMIVLLSMTVGNALASIISPSIAKMLGGFILISLGIFSLINIIRSQHKQDNFPKPDDETTNRMQNFKTVLSTPDKADLDKSGAISAGEALLLGSALALDAFGAGIGAAIIGYPALVTAVLIACMSGLFLICGIRVGIALSQNEKMKKLTFLPPGLLIVLGVLNIL